MPNVTFPLPQSPATFGHFPCFHAQRLPLTHHADIFRYTAPYLHWQSGRQQTVALTMAGPAPTDMQAAAAMAMATTELEYRVELLNRRVACVDVVQHAAILAALICT